MEIRFAIVPTEKSVNNRIGKLGKRLGNKFPHRFVVDNKKYFPHATLFKVDLPQAKYKDLLKVTQNFTKQSKTFEVEVKDFLKANNTFLMLKIKPHKQLSALRKKLFKEVQKSGLIKKASIKPLYHPHFTLARFYSPSRVNEVIDKETDQFRVKVKAVALCLSRQTQVYKILDKVTLK